MTIEYAILGLLSLRPLSGYDIKKVFAGTTALYWSDNNNLIYRALLKLHREQLVEQEVQLQENYPARKVYHISAAGREALRQWAAAPAELPQLKQTFLIQLAWADLLTPPELDALLGAYEEEVETQLLMCRAEQRGAPVSLAGKPRETYLQHTRARTAREAYLWEMIQANWIGFYEQELAWARELRSGLAAMSGTGEPPENS